MRQWDKKEERDRERGRSQTQSERNEENCAYADGFVVGAAEQQSTCLCDGQRTNAVAMSNQHGAALQGRLLAHLPYLHIEDMRVQMASNKHNQRADDRHQ